MKIINYIKKHGIMHSIFVLYHYKLQIAINCAVKIIVKDRPLKNTIIIRSHNDFDTNGGAFYDFLIRNGYNKKYKIVWILRNNKPKDLKLHYNVKAYYALKPCIKKAIAECTAKFITYDDEGIKKSNPEQQLYYLTHGPIGLKAFRGEIVIPNDVDCILAPSEFLAPILAKQYGFPYPNSLQQILGYPMHDVFYCDEIGDLEKITSQKFSKVILWMPTFRKHWSSRNDSMSNLPLGIPIFKNQDSCEQLNAFLRKENALLIVKIHPMQDLSTVKIKDMSNIFVLDANSVKILGIDNYRLMKDVDALISDYSSVAYDFLHVNKPIGFTLDDVKDYKLGLLFDEPEQYMPGHIIYTQEEFMSFIEDVINGKDPYSNDRRRVFDLFFKYHDGNSCQRLAEYMGLKL